MKVLTILGTRPEAIKMAPVIKMLQQHAHEIESKICVTAQHRDLLDQVLTLYEIQPDYDLQVMQDKQTLSYLTSTILTKLEPVLNHEHPDWILVHGDTTTAMAGALAGFYHQISIGHVEAGLRTHNLYAPFPEEANRRIADSLCHLHFAPTDLARQNLLKEGHKEDSIFVTGNTVIDALLDIVQRHDTSTDQFLNTIIMPDRRLILVTAHRRENFGQPLQFICEAILDLSKRYGSNVQILYPMHPNPNVRERVSSMLRGHENITLIDPLDYLPFVHVMDRAHLILTDSGGIQEEAPSLGKPVLVLRDETERPEGVSAGTLRLVGANRDRIVHEAVCLLDNPDEYEKMAKTENPYGDGHASERIVDVLIRQTMKQT